MAPHLRIPALSNKSESRGENSEDRNESRNGQRTKTGPGRKKEQRRGHKPARVSHIRNERDDTLINERRRRGYGVTMNEGDIDTTEDSKILQSDEPCMDTCSQNEDPPHNFPIHVPLHHELPLQSSLL